MMIKFNFLFIFIYLSSYGYSECDEPQKIGCKKIGYLTNDNGIYPERGIICNCNGRDTYACYETGISDNSFCDEIYTFGENSTISKNIDTACREFCCINKGLNCILNFDDKIMEISYCESTSCRFDIKCNQTFIDYNINECKDMKQCKDLCFIQKGIQDSHN